MCLFAWKHSGLLAEDLGQPQPLQRLLETRNVNPRKQVYQRLPPPEHLLLPHHRGPCTPLFLERIETLQLSWIEALNLCTFRCAQPPYHRAHTLYSRHPLSITGYTLYTRDMLRIMTTSLLVSIVSDGQLWCHSPPYYTLRADAQVGLMDEREA